jgi:two-component system chemotaxis sensor kinase CheA
MSYDATSDQEFIRAAMPAFISEAAEQIEAIETLLLELEEQPDNRELLDSLFRCAHTVKGSAGIFGLTRVVEFTHHVETLLDKMRDGELALNPDISTLLLQCNDQIKFLVDTAADESADTPDQMDLRADLVVQLRALTEGGEASPASPESTGTAAPAASGGLRIWSISAVLGLRPSKMEWTPHPLRVTWRAWAVWFPCVANPIRFPLWSISIRRIAT